MKFGLYGINVGPCVEPETAARVAQAAETAGMASADLGALSRAETAREPGRTRLEISTTPPPGLDVDTARRFGDLGVDRLVLLPVARSGDELVRFVEEAGETLIPKLA